MARKITLHVWEGENHLGEVTADFIDDTMSNEEMIAYTKNLLKTKFGDSIAVTESIDIIEKEPEINSCMEPGEIKE